jgi:UTP--glucose-1-phosphate uridylyltransferase
LEAILRAKGKEEQAEMVRNIVPAGIECMFVRQAEQLGLGHAVLCAERAVGDDPFTVLLADDFLTDYEPGVTADLVQAFAASGKSQLSVMEVDGPEIAQYGVVVPSASGAGIAGLVEKPSASDAPSNLASIGRYVLTPDFFDTLRGLRAGSGGEIQLADAINIHAQSGLVEMVHLNGKRYDCGSVAGFMAASSHEFASRGFR